MTTDRGTATRLDVSDDIEETYGHFEDEGFGDGHPIVPPTEERVERFLADCLLESDTEIAVLPPALGIATVEKIAINAVMAGCRPEYADVVLAAIQVLGDPQIRELETGPMMTTAHSISPLLIINGPIAKELAITSGADGSAVSWRANATIARAVRLSLINIGGIRGTSDCNTFGWLPKYMYAMAEDEAASPWESLSVEKGFAADDDTVTVFWKEPPHHMELSWEITAHGLLAAFCDSMCTVASRASYGDGNVLLGLSPRHAGACAGAGFSKRDVKRFIFEHARTPFAAYGPAAGAKFRADWRKFYTHSPDCMVPMAASPDEIDVIVLGGSGPESLYFPHGRGAHTKKIERHWRR
jgi:hypothetical protein